MGGQGKLMLDAMGMALAWTAVFLLDGIRRLGRGLRRREYLCVLVRCNTADGAASSWSATRTWSGTSPRGESTRTPHEEIEMTITEPCMVCSESRTIDAANEQYRRWKEDGTHLRAKDPTASERCCNTPLPL